MTAFEKAWALVKEDMECCGEPMSYLESGEYYYGSTPDEPKAIWIFQCERCGNEIEDGMQDEANP